jgi:hypothetical protein
VKRLLLTMLPMLIAVFANASVQHPQDKPTYEKPDTCVMHNCPRMLDGKDVAVLDTPTGIVITVTTTSENVADLQRRLEQMTAMHDTAGEGEAPHEAMMRGRIRPVR